MNATKLNRTTKKAENWINAYFNSSCYSVIDWYASSVPNKRSIESKIKVRLSDSHLIGYKVICGNCFAFTCGYMSADSKTLYIETASKIYAIEL